MSNQIYLCLGSGTEAVDYYEGNEPQNQDPSGGVFRCLAYQFSFSNILDGFNQETGNIQGLLRLTIAHPSGLPQLLQRQMRNRAEPIRVVVRGQNPSTGAMMSLVDYSGGAKLIATTPHQPNVDSPVNSAFGDMTDVEFKLLGDLQIQEFLTGMNTTTTLSQITV